MLWWSQTSALTITERSADCRPSAALHTFVMHFDESSAGFVVVDDGRRGVSVGDVLQFDRVPTIAVLGQRYPRLGREDLRIDGLTRVVSATLFARHMDCTESQDNDRSIACRTRYLNVRDALK